jgi:hypothetical protein
MKVLEEFLQIEYCRRMYEISMDSRRSTDWKFVVSENDIFCMFNHMSM